MKGERIQPLIRARMWIWLPVLLMGTVVGGDCLVLVDGQAAPAGVQSAQHDLKGITGLVTCHIDSDCADGDSCTQDICTQGICLNPAVQGCVPTVLNYVCPPLDVVFIMDTSGSMKDEAVALCASIDQILADLVEQDVVVNASLLGITETGDSTFACLTDDVVTLFGDTVPGDPTGCVFPDGAASYESWGPATAIVAERFPWNDDAMRIIIPLGDEGPCNGNLPDGCNDPGDDRDSIENAIAVAGTHDVIVSPITGTGSNSCVITLANDLATGTGGSAINTQDAGLDLPDAVVTLLLEHCEDKGPLLCLEAAPGILPAPWCYKLGNELVVNVKLWPSMRIITGGQFFFAYDRTVLEVIDVRPGHVVDANSPFSVELFEFVDDIAGTIFYAVGIPFGASGTHGPAVMATIRFRPIEVCAIIDPMCFADDNPRITRLTDEDGFSVPYIPCCTDELTITGDNPVLECPGSVTVNADADSVTAVVTWAPIHADADCGGDVQLTCTAVHSEGVDIDDLIETGGEFPPGRAEFECNASDACGLTASCSWMVQVNRANTVEATVQLSPVIVPRALNRCIEFELYSADCTESPVVVGETLKFGPPLGLPGQARNVEFHVPAGQYFCMTARDPLHTLRSASNLQIVDGKYVATFRGDPAYGENWLIGGNLNDDHVIDILDFGVYLTQFGAILDPDTPCDTPSPHADINGDGVVDSLDFSFIQSNLGSGDTGSCCPGGSGSSAASPVTEISISELKDRGLSHLRRADINGDSVLDEGDVAAFLRGERPGKPVRIRGRNRE